MAAAKEGVDRIEISGALCSGGVTPTPAMVEMALSTGIEIAVMLRSSEGWLKPSATEIQVMLKDLEWIREKNVCSIVFGSLNKNQEIDIELALKVQDAAQIPVTIHRVIDYTPNFHQSIEKLVKNKFQRVLTSGGKDNVDLGLKSLIQIQSEFGNEIEILAGGGVNAKNAPTLISQAKINQLHFSMVKKSGMGYGGIPLTEPDPEKIRKIKASIAN